MLKLFVLIVIIAALFLFLPPMPAAFWSILPLVIMAGVFFDAMKRGRYILARRREEADAVDDMSRLFAGVMIFQAVWVGLSAPASATPDGMGSYGGDVGGDLGGFDGGGFDGGGGDGGGGGGF